VESREQGEWMMMMVYGGGEERAGRPNVDALRMCDWVKAGHGYKLIITGDNYPPPYPYPLTYSSLSSHFCSSSSTRPSACTAARPLLNFSTSSGLFLHTAMP
jgi:hypothetical protein